MMNDKRGGDKTIHKQSITQPTKNSGDKLRCLLGVPASNYAGVPGKPPAVVAGVFSASAGDESKSYQSSASKSV